MIIRGVKIVGITAMLVILIIVMPSLVLANEVLWGDPVVLDIDYQNKNKWIAETVIHIEGESFDTLALLFQTEKELPSNTASIEIKGLTNKAYVNITQNLSNPGSWNIVYLAEPIIILPWENYTVKIVIKANADSLVNENIIGETRSDLIEYSLFKVGDTVNEIAVTVPPAFSTGGSSEANLEDYDLPTIPGEAEPPEINYWALMGVFLILFSVTAIKVWKIPPMAWALMGLSILLISVGLFG